MDGMLSQEEINALLGGGLASTNASNSSGAETLSDSERDALGEISNICMGTAATTLYSLVNQKVVITTPVVSITRWEELTFQVLLVDDIPITNEKKVTKDFRDVFYVTDDSFLEEVEEVEAIEDAIDELQEEEEEGLSFDDIDLEEY